MEDLTKEPDSKHRMLMVSHTPPMPPKAVFVSKSCPDFVTEFPHAGAGGSLRAHSLSTSLPSQLNVVERLADREVSIVPDMIMTVDVINTIITKNL